ncbi:uncharacterized protein zbtb32 [Halichoeres trimaculatus]|uniref:uncharacterized protein zbtb32 n=1 Tax=Halichoeres trimaculatus TaxID=147232 RepID=UPI003D9DD945
MATIEARKMLRLNNTQYFHFLEQADALRRSGSLCDAIISVKNQTFQAHRLVLACASRRLAQLLTQGDTDSPVHCSLESFSPHTFQQVLDFTYTQTLEVSVEDLQLLLRAAQLLEMQQLEEQCWEQLDSVPRNISQPPVKKQKVSPVSYSRDSVIIRPAASSSSYSPPWTFPTNMWSSMSTLRHIAEYAAHPRQPQNQFSLFTPHLFPLLGSHFQSSVMGYSAFHPGYTQNQHPGPRGVGGIIKQGLLKRKRSTQRAFRAAVQPKQTSFQEEAKSSTQRVKTCPHCSTSIKENPSSTASEACSFCGRAEVLLHEPQSQRQEHRGEKPYQCQLCPKKFSLKHQLDTHHRVHTGEKPFECRLCGQRSRDYSAMIKHLRTHGGAAPYQCNVCREFCSSLVAMQRHVKGHAVQDFPPDWSINSTYLYTSHI